MKVELCPVYMVDAVWPSLQKGFSAAVEKTGGDLSEIDLRVAARTGQGFLFIAYEGQEVRGASLWRTDAWASGQRFRCLALFGKGMADWIYLMRDEVKKVAGSMWLVADGRSGWPAPFPDVKKLRVVYEDRNP
jgi:hypothetical protein